MENAYAVIMAGGSGTRFWPLSRRAKPKQLLSLIPGEARSLLAATVARVEPLIPIERVLIVTGAHLVDAVQQVLPELPAENILAEPAARNTAPCVGWAAAHVARKDPDALLAVLPADHHIADEPTFRAKLTLALEHASGGDLVTIGIRPTRPETGYGYIEVGDEVREGVNATHRFVEKPNPIRAAEFLAAGNYLWNAGMFFFQVSAILGEFKRSLPGASAILDEIIASPDPLRTATERFCDMPSISIDHGLMEKADRVAVVPGSFGWSDLGSWHSAWEHQSKDDEGNALGQGAIALGSEGCYVRTQGGKLVALVGVKDLVVVDTEDALLIMPRGESQRVKEVVAQLKADDDPRT